jgi:hypothetical protein
MLDDAVPLLNGIDRCRRTQFGGELSPICDRLDDDNLCGAADTGGLHDTHADRSGAEHRNVGARLDLQQCVAGGKAGDELVASNASSPAGTSVKTGQQYSSKTDISSLNPPRPPPGTTGVPSRIVAKGGQGSSMNVN